MMNGWDCRVLYVKLEILLKEELLMAVPDGKKDVGLEDHFETI
jgi:hypothetical protein